MTGECSVALLELALAGNLSGEPEESLHRHLGECEACTRALEQMAGGAAWCQEAASLLMRDDLDHAVPAREEWSNVDFTVEHLEPSDQPDVLGRLGGYDVLEIIGRGGTGVVLKAFDRELKRCVAIKVLAPHLAQSSLARKRFAREAQAAASVVHPNVLAIHQVQPTGPLPFLVMPLVAGESLAQRLIAQGRLELKETLRIGMQAAAGLAAAHEQGLVHRDVKPANILLEKGVERAVLTDFGLARAADDVSMTRWGIIAGTPQYMSPEQARGEPLDGRSDLFSLGCVLYEMATGVSPFRADSTLATLRRLIDDAPPAMASLNPELPPWFIAIVERLLEKDPSQRFGSAKEVSELLEGCLAHLQQPASVPLPAAAAVPAARRVSRLRTTLLKGGIAMIATLGIGLLGMFLVQSTEPPDIAGRWSGEGWGQVVLTETAAGEYAGTYGGSAGKEPGKIELKWSRIQRRFNGAWRQRDDCFGEISLRLAANEIRGARTADPKAKIDPATPRLVDLVWTRVESTRPPKDETPPVRSAEGGVQNRIAAPAWQDMDFSAFQAGVGVSFEKMVPLLFACVDCQSVPKEQRKGEAEIKQKSGEAFKEFEQQVAAHWPYSDPQLEKQQRASEAAVKEIYSLFSRAKGGESPSIDRDEAIRRILQLGRSFPNSPVSDLAQFHAAYLFLDVKPQRRDEGYALFQAMIESPAPMNPSRISAMGNLAYASDRVKPSRTERYEQFSAFLRDLHDPAKLKAHLLNPLPIETQRRYVQRVLETVTNVEGSRLLLVATMKAEADRIDRAIRRFDPGMRVGTIACSPDGKVIAVGNESPSFTMLGSGRSKVNDGWQPAVRIVDGATGNAVVSLALTTREEDAVLAATERVSHSEVKALAFSPDGNIVAVGTGMGQVRLFNARTGELARLLDDEKARLADKKTPESWKSLRRAMGSVASLAFSPDGTLLATCGSSFGDFSRVFESVERSGRLGTGPGRLKVWEVTTGTLQHDLLGHSHANAVAFSADGNLLASAGSWEDGRANGTGVIIWNPHTGTKIRAITTEANGGTHAVVFSPKSELVVIGSRHFDKENDTSTTAVSLTYALSGITEWRQTVPGWAKPAAFSPNGKSVVVLCGGQSIRFLDAETGALKHEVRSADFPQGGRWSDVAIAPQGHRLAIGGVTKDKQGCVETWDFKEGPAAPR